MLRASPRTPELSEISDEEFNRAYFKELRANRHDDWGSSDASDAGGSSVHRKKKSHKKPPQTESESEASSDKQVKKMPKTKEEKKKKQEKRLKSADYAIKKPKVVKPTQQEEKK